MRRAQAVSTKLIAVDGIDVEVTRKRIKNMYLRVRRGDGRAVVSAPLFTSEAAIRAFVSTKADWIRRKQAEEKKRSAHAGANASGAYACEEALFLWGERYAVETSFGGRFGVVLADGTARITLRRGSSREQQEAAMREWYRAQLCARAERLVPLWEARTGLVCNEWRTKDMKTRWGTCNTRDRRIWLNVQLAKYPPECVEYIILHELAHLREPSHGAAFKAILDEHMPNWRSVRATLNAHPVGCPSQT